MSAPEILAVGIATPVGLDAAGAAAAIRADVCRFAAGKFRNRSGKPQVISRLDDKLLPPLHPDLALGARGLPVRARLLRLATHALQEAAAGLDQPVPLLLAAPEARAGVPDPVGSDLMAPLATQAGVALDLRSSRLYRQGGAAGLLALRDAVALLASGRATRVLVGGVDSLTDPGLLRALDAEKRLTGASPDGFIPGEGAAFLLLGPAGAARRDKVPPLAAVLGVAAGVEKGHRYSEEPYLGEGLAGVFQLLFAAQPAEPRVGCVYAGLNGESLGAKEWGVALLRSADRFADDFAVEHPADRLGDAGAALGPIMLALAALGIQAGQHPPRCLVWSTSDREPRAAALLGAVA
ncbi:MAG: hypothetical protein HZB56_16705 [Deltaproteobacteria bacterium]|nr:hypothetical protein [Deltaproteobacteria bacterium]